MITINNEELVAAMKDLGFEKLPIGEIPIDQNVTISNPFTTCMSAVDQVIGGVMAAHASWKSKMAAYAALLEIQEGSIK